MGVRYRGGVPWGETAYFRACQTRLELGGLGLEQLFKSE